MDVTKEIITEVNDPNTASARLVELASHDYWWVRRQVAGHRNTPVGTVIELADDEHEEVRLKVASVVKDTATLTRLAQDASWYPRLEVARNVYTPRSVRLSLSQDRNRLVRKTAATYAARGGAA